MKLIRPTVWTTDGIGRHLSIPPCVKAFDCARCRRLCVRQEVVEEDQQVSTLAAQGYAVVYGRHVDGRPVCEVCLAREVANATENG